MMRRRTLLAAMLAIPSAAAQQPWPNRPVRWILPDAPGSGNDTVARLLASHLQAALGQPIVIELRGGAGGRLGVETAFRATPDGYTFLFGNAGSNGINAAIYRDLPYDLPTAFDPIALVVVGPNVLVVNPRAIPVNSVAELLALIRARPGQLNYASGGIGASNHLGMELLKHMERLDVQHVPYRGTQQMAQAAISGDAPVLFGNLTNLMPFIRAGELRALAISTAQRSPMLPEVPTMQEAGVAGYETAAWNGLLAPRGTPQPILDRMHAELVKLRDHPELRDRVTSIGGELVMSTPQAFAQRIRDDVAKWRELADRASIRPE
jgi:tripartite-type tricarboxylate transporter receptor subunit TctC